jgi:hypothetical protein
MKILITHEPSKEAAKGSREKLMIDAGQNISLCLMI